MVFFKKIINKFRIVFFSKNLYKFFKVDYSEEHGNIAGMECQNCSAELIALSQKEIDDLHLPIEIKLVHLSDTFAIYIGNTTYDFLFNIKKHIILVNTDVSITKSGGTFLMNIDKNGDVVYDKEQEKERIRFACKSMFDYGMIVGKLDKWTPDTKFSKIVKK